MFNMVLNHFAYMLPELALFRRIVIMMHLYRSLSGNDVLRFSKNTDFISSNCSSVKIVSIWISTIIYLLVLCTICELFCWHVLVFQIKPKHLCCFDQSASDAGDIRVKSTRKSTNPVKRPTGARRPLAADDGVRIVAATAPLAQKCEDCTFTCNTALQLKMHAYECHEKRGAGDALAFACRYCKMATDVKESLQRHTAQHTGKHTIRWGHSRAHR